MNQTAQYIVNNSVVKVIDCGQMIYSLSEKVNNTVKIIVLIMLFLLIFEMWAIKRIINSGETHDKKKNLIDMVLTFIHPIMILFIFYIIYWIFLSGIDW